MQLLRPSLLVALSALAAPAAAQSDPADSGTSGPVVEIPGLRASLVSEPRAVAVGEPMTWTLELRHPRELAPVLPAEDLGLGPQWVVLEELGTLSEASPDGIDEPGFRITRKRWIVMGLARSQVLPSMEIFFGEGEDALSILTPEGELEVRSVIGPGEQFARIGKGFRDVEELAPAGARLPWWSVASAVTGVLVVVWWIVRRRRGRVSDAPPVAPLDQLESLERSLPDDLPALQALHYSLTALVRQATEQRLGLAFPGTTDTEWLERVRDDERIREEVGEKLERVIRDAESVKYARRKPTRWAIEETLEAARGALEEVGRASGGAR